MSESSGAAAKYLWQLDKHLSVYALLFTPAAATSTTPPPHSQRRLAKQKKKKKMSTDTWTSGGGAGGGDGWRDIHSSSARADANLLAVTKSKRLNPAAPRGDAAAVLRRAAAIQRKKKEKGNQKNRLDLIF